MDRICVYCGSNPGRRQSYAGATESLGAALVSRDITLVYGGGRTGLMGVLADAVLGAGGTVHGIVPEPIVDRQPVHDGLSRLDVVDTMHERKELMVDRSDGFIALPGGFGTVEELMEAITWAQLDIHGDPCGLLNVDDYYSPLLGFVRQQVAEGFVSQADSELLLVATSPDALLDQMAAASSTERDGG